jgi:hypothetical protein
MKPHSTWKFRDIDEAGRAQQALKQAGIAEENLRIDVVTDEAAPMQGNFALEYKDAASSNDDSFLDRIFSTDDPNEGQGRQAVDWHCVCVLVVLHDSEQAEALVRQTLEGFETQEKATVAP